MHTHTAVRHTQGRWVTATVSDFQLNHHLNIRVYSLPGVGVGAIFSTTPKEDV